MRFGAFNELRLPINALLSEKLNFFSSMKSKSELGQVIELANQKPTYEEKAEEFLKLIKQ